MRVARGEHAGRLDAPLGDRRPPRRPPPLPRAVVGRGVRVGRRRRRLAPAQRRLGHRVPARDRAGVRSRSRTASACIPQQPDRLYQQNHCGIYRIDRPDGRWVRIGDNMPTEVGDIGFPIELHPRDPDTAWVFPMDGTDVWPRTSPDGRPAAYVTRDAGESWTRCDAGLPEPGVAHGEAPGHDRRRRRPGRRVLRHHQR